MPSLAPWSAHSADAADTRLSQQAAASGVAPSSEAPYLFLILCLIHGLSPGWCPKRTPREGREPVCWGEEVPPPLSPKGNLPSPPGSPPSSPTMPFPTEAMGTATRHPRSKVLPPILPPPCRCLSLQSLPSPSHLHHRPLAPDSPSRGAVCPVCRVQTEPRSPSHPRVGSDRPGQNDALNPRPGALEGQGPLPLSSDSLPHLTLRGPDASL